MKLGRLGWSGAVAAVVGVLAMPVAGMLVVENDSYVPLAPAAALIFVGTLLIVLGRRR